MLKNLVTFIVLGGLESGWQLKIRMKQSKQKNTKYGKIKSLKTHFTLFCSKK